MNTTQLLNRYKTFVIPVAVSLLFTLILFYIDEGRYSLDGLFKPGNLIAMFIYYLGILWGILWVQNLMFKKYKGIGKVVLTYIIGLPLGFVLSLAMIFILFLIFNTVKYQLVD